MIDFDDALIKGNAHALGTLSPDLRRRQRAVPLSWIYRLYDFVE
ncbi:hypothetical protein [Lysobacter sp. CA199]